MNRDIKIIIKKDIIFNQNISSQAFMTYVGLAICLKPGMDLIYADKDMLYYYLSGLFDNTPRKFNESLRNGFNELVNNNIISCKKKKSSSYYLDAKDFVINETDNYVCIYLSEIRKLVCSDYHGKSKLLRFYMCLLSTFILNNKIRDIRDENKYNNVLSMVSQEHLSNISQISSHTTMEYIKLLEQLQLIYVSRCSFMFKDGKGNVKKHNNIYGRYADKDIINEFTRVRYEMYDDLHKTQLSTAANKSRSLMQKYNYLCKGIVYDLDIMNEIYQYICEYNKKHPKKQKDMSVFNIGGYCIRDDKIII